ncbi:restriction endonuclease subunit S [Actinocorallia sp. A-T 12471]|uniref:restriction endonuclease subunit S n=1 Tax=Actinocorallia sp. A-T 12471 TaxID=3089813 RepID=UPI0029D054F7|nr:restriction endonuclease subunit S [Actinocorallia sp. A-T 12471]MDX6738701.1 restriction endonuclease subunit S [Actinocorallia sp. A-T 12471]
MTELPQGWTKKTLKELGVVAQPGFASGKHNRDGGLVHLRPMNISRDGKIVLSDVRFIEDSSERRVRFGDVLFNNTNSPALVGKTAFVTSEKPLAYSNHMTRLRPLDNLDSKFLATQLHWLWMQGYFKTVLNNHVNQASVASKTLLQTEIVVPPLPEQKFIVATLEKILTRLATGTEATNFALQKAAQLNKLIEDHAVLGLAELPIEHEGSGQDSLSLVTSSRQQMVTKSKKQAHQPESSRYVFPEHWTIASVDQLCWKIEYGTSAKCHSTSSGSDIPVIRMGNIQAGSIDMANLKYLPTAHPDVAKLFLNNGDLLFNRTNSAELVGKSAVYKDIYGPATFASYLIRCRFLDGVIPEWVNLVINSSLGRSYIKSVASQQVGQANVNGTKLARMPIPFPPLREQQRILNNVRTQKGALSAMVNSTSSLNGNFETLKASILDSAFSGSLGSVGVEQVVSQGVEHQSKPANDKICGTQLLIDDDSLGGL